MNPVHDCDDPSLGGPGVGVGTHGRSFPVHGEWLEHAEILPNGFYWFIDDDPNTLPPLRSCRVALGQRCEHGFSFVPVSFTPSDKDCDGEEGPSKGGVPRRAWRQLADDAVRHPPTDVDWASRSVSIDDINYHTGWRDYNRTLRAAREQGRRLADPAHGGDCDGLLVDAPPRVPGRCPDCTTHTHCARFGVCWGG